MYQIIAHEVKEVNVLEHKKKETHFTLAKTDLLESRLKFEVEYQKPLCRRTETFQQVYHGDSLMQRCRNVRGSQKAQAFWQGVDAWNSQGE